MHNVKLFHISKQILVFVYEILFSRQKCIIMVQMRALLVRKDKSFHLIKGR
jgi:hypothetical protein